MKKHVVREDSVLLLYLGGERKIPKFPNSHFWFFVCSQNRENIYWAAQMTRRIMK